ncbi:MAG: formylglycine-generating enzyme family protein [Planctomyces sp.]|jgi:sulfatase modifying factor 1
MQTVLPEQIPNEKLCFLLNSNATLRLTKVGSSARLIAAVMFLQICCLVPPDCQAGETIAGIAADKPVSGPSVEIPGGWMVPYDVQIPGTDVSIRMIPVPGGTFRIGSSAGEPGHQADEVSSLNWKTEPFWIAECETAWEQYKPFMSLYRVFKEFVTRNERLVTDANRIDAITAPTPLYEPDFTFEFGENPKQPAVSMTQYAAKQFTKWISLCSEHNYRLPTEAEWEFACRAGTTTAWSFGDDAAKLPEYAWFAENAAGKGTRTVRSGQPNPWGLYDMHGNVAEWVLDAYAPYPDSEVERVRSGQDDWARPDRPYPRVVRGGSWEFSAIECRSASRLGSDDKAWKQYDPNLPNSPWWFTTDPARGVGFRIVRPLKPLSREAMEEFWKIDCEDTQYDVDDRLNEGRGVLGLVDKELPAKIRELAQ